MRWGALPVPLRHFSGTFAGETRWEAGYFGLAPGHASSSIKGALFLPLGDAFSQCVAGFVHSFPGRILSFHGIYFPL